MCCSTNLANSVELDLAVNSESAEGRISRKDISFSANYIATAFATLSEIDK